MADASAFKEAAEYIVAAKFYEDQAGPWISHNPALARSYYELAVECYKHAYALLLHRERVSLVLEDVLRQLVSAREMVAFYDERTKRSSS